MLHERFNQRLGARWHTLQQGNGRILLTESGLRLLTVNAQQNQYHNAQIDDYGNLARSHFPWRPPLRLTVQARFPTPLAGTAGFGFWNNPFSPVGGTVPALPAALWFFHASQPSNMVPALGVPGYGWKAACIDLTTREALAWAPLALPVILLNRVPRLYRRIWPRVQRALRVSESAMGRLHSEWRRYTIEWKTSYARLAVDGTTVLETDRPPAGPLGFVAWVDTQWLIMTPQGQFGWGLLPVPEAQWMELGMLRIEQ